MGVNVGGGCAATVADIVGDAGTEIIDGVLEASMGTDIMGGGVVFVGTRASVAGTTVGPMREA